MPTEQEYDQSLEEILYGDFYPKKSVTYQIEGLLIPFAPLSGEYIDYLGTLPDGIIALSNYRIFANCKDVCIVNLPIGLIESLEFPSSNVFLITCKNGQYYRCSFHNDDCGELYRRLSEALKTNAALSTCFALAFCAWSRTEGICSDEFKGEMLPHQTSVFDREVQRMGFCLDPKVKAWRICEANMNYSVCSTYPRKHVVPFSITDEMVSDMAKYRSHQRFPSIVWRDIRSGLVMARSSQPLPGVFWWRNSSDEVFLSSIGNACRSNPGPEWLSDDNATQTTKDLLLIDARSYGSAFLNRAKGGGVECQEYYTNAVVVFMNLQNIHGIRKSFNQLKFYCGAGYDDAQWLTLLDQSKWLLHVLNLLKSALVIVDGIEIERKSVLVHCSDGWDRTPTILSIAQILLDPHYRTIKGFRDLIEREWLEFGHKFADRCGQGLCSNDTNERSPIFLQWLDCVHQIHHQFPCYFEFNMNLLIKLAYHTYSCLFGDFLYNSDFERFKHSDQKTVSIWGFLLNDAKLINPLYQLFNKPLRPQCLAKDMHFWSQVYMRKHPAVVTSTFVEELKSGIDNVEETGNDLNEGMNGQDANEKDISPLKDVLDYDNRAEPAATFALESDAKRRSLSLDRHSENGFGSSTSDLLQSLSLENFESNRLATQCHGETGSLSPIPNDDFPSYCCNSSDADRAVKLCKTFQPEMQESKYLTPKVSRTKQDDINQPLIGKDELSRRIFRQLDVDGLTLDVDYHSMFMSRMMILHQMKLDELHKQMEEMRKKSEPGKTDSETRDDSSLSSNASDSTWEVINRMHNRLVLWVPDHVVSQCSNCEKGFWIGLRRHHCRSCGKIFCFECTRRTMPCPDQLLNMPVRVCEACYAEANGPLN